MTTFDETIARAVLLRMGIQPQRMGYAYLLDGLRWCANHDGNHDAGTLTKNIYPWIARLHQTTARAVERNIRSAITCAQPPEKKPLFVPQPTNGGFMAMAWEYTQMATANKQIREDLVCLDNITQQKGNE